MIGCVLKDAANSKQHALEPESPFLFSAISC